MRRGELESQISITNRWWRRPRDGRRWESDDRDLISAGRAPYTYRPGVLHDLVAGGLYALFGPRRVGKSVEVKRAISELLDGGIDPHRVVHAACNTWQSRDLTTLVQLIDELAPPATGPRYLFLDEITAIKEDWIGTLAWLRDQTALGSDCVVLSGSSAEDLERARNDLAGRRGPAADADRILLPMGFRSFCRVTDRNLPDAPTIHPQDMLEPEATAVIAELRPHLTDLVAAWERYLEIGGFPRAVTDWIVEREVSDEFENAVWDAVHGLTLVFGDWTAAQSQALLEAIAKRITSRINKADVARDLGGIHHQTLDLRLNALHNAFVTWPCHLSAAGGRPDLASQSKIYFVDPVHARLAHFRRPNVAPPDYTQMTEQQLGVALLRAHERTMPGSFRDGDVLFYHRSSTGNEVDFTGPWLNRLPYEGKYTEGAWLRKTQTAQAAFGGCVLATRNVIDRTDQRLAIPAGMLAYLLDDDRPTSSGSS